MRILGRTSPSIKTLCKNAESYKYYSERTGCIEIVRPNKAIEQALGWACALILSSEEYLKSFEAADRHEDLRVYLCVHRFG
eukprot:851204-Pleurochrysis_carterae.AAC.2